jgi:hypothetical protein
MSASCRWAQICSRTLLPFGSRLTARRLAAVPLLAALLALAACGGGDGTTEPPPPDTQVARVEVTAAAASVPENQTVQLTARALSASGAVLAGKTFTWQSSNPAIATVDANGVVKGLAEGSATISTAESATGTTGTVALGVVPAPVVAVSVSAPLPRVKSGKQLQLAVTLTDATGRVLTGREVTWSVSAPAVASIGANGLLLARTPGTVTITAASGGKSGSVAVEVFQLAPARIAISPELTSMAVGETVQLRAAAVDAEGDTIPPAQLAWTVNETRRTGAAVLAATSEAGGYRGAALGYATVRAELGGLSSNTAVVAVLGAGELVATAFPNGSQTLRARAGDRVTVPVVLDMSRVATPGDLGAVELEIAYDRLAVVLRSATPGIAGTAGEGGTPGRYRLSLATATPTASPRLTVVSLVFEVAAAAVAGSTVPFTLTFPSAPTSTGFAAYPQPVVLNGSLLIVPN